MVEKPCLAVPSCLQSGFSCYETYADTVQYLRDEKMHGLFDNSYNSTTDLA